MADFPIDYFQAETRDGFFIEAMMKCAWAAYVEVLETFDSLCTRHGLKYFAAYGTMLGAVRHKGFIPWDDDVDIFMFREDYDRLLHLPAQELPSGFFLHSIYENNIHPQLYAIFVNSSKIDYSPEHLRHFHGCPYVVGLDIYPLDNLSDNESEIEAQAGLLRIVLQVIQLYYQSPDAALELLPEIESLCNVRLNREHNLKNQLLKVADNICQMYRDTSNGDLISFTSNLNRFYRMKREWFQETLRMPFETSTVPVPVGRHEVLTAIFGDYMTPVRGIQAHDYPFYREQERILTESILQERGAADKRTGVPVNDHKNRKGDI